MTDKQRNRALERKGDRLVRLAFALEREVAAMRAFAPRDYCEGVYDLSSRAGNIGRELLDLSKAT